MPVNRWACKTPPLKRWSKSLAGLILLGVSACQSVPPIPDTTQPLSWAQRKAFLRDLPSFSAKGRVSVKAEQTAQQGDFRLNQNGDEYLLQLSGPFGLGQIDFEGTASSVVMTSARHGTMTLDDPENQLTTLLGYTVPLTAIRYWALGVPQPRVAAFEELDPDHPRLIALEQANWRIEYAEYRLFDDLELPRKVDFYGPGVQIRMVFRAWSIPQ